MPTAPYCDSGDVYLMRAYMRDPGATDFPVDGVPNRTLVDYWVTQCASRIDMKYASIGYEIPLTARSGETWPTHQTNFLKYFNAIGVAAMIGGDATTPPVIAFVGGRRVERSFYEYEWMQLMAGFEQIKGHQVGDVLVRASTRAGTPADYMLTDASPPLTDFLEGYDDPTRWDSLRDFTKRHKYYVDKLLENNKPSTTVPASWEWLYMLHYRLGLTYDE